LATDGQNENCCKATKPTKSGPKVYRLLEYFSTGKRRLLNNPPREDAERRADNGRSAEIRKLKAKGIGLRAIARQLKMPPSSVHKALSMAA